MLTPHSPILESVRSNNCVKGFEFWIIHFSSWLRDSRDRVTLELKLLLPSRLMLQSPPPDKFKEGRDAKRERERERREKWPPDKIYAPTFISWYFTRSITVVTTSYGSRWTTEPLAISGRFCPQIERYIKQRKYDRTVEPRDRVNAKSQSWISVIFTIHRKIYLGDWKKDLIPSPNILRTNLS